MQAPARRAWFHGERQDTSAPGWLHMLALIDEAAADGREVFRPLVEMSPEERRQVVTLPPSVGRLTGVRHLVLYRSNLVRLPAEIGAMASLEVLEPYTSPRLHWFPYELTRCRNLKSSTVSTRRIFGNFKYRPPFPELRQGPVPPGGPDPGLWGRIRSAPALTPASRPCRRGLRAMPEPRIPAAPASPSRTPATPRAQARHLSGDCRTGAVLSPGSLGEPAQAGHGPPGKCT